LTVDQTARCQLISVAFLNAGHDEPITAVCGYWKRDFN